MTDTKCIIFHARLRTTELSPKDLVKFVLDIEPSLVIKSLADECV